MHPLLIAGGAACLLLVDLLACTLRRVPLAGLPLLTIYSVPVSMTGDGPALDPLHPHRGRLPLDDLPVRVRAGRPLGPDPGRGPRPLRARSRSRSATWPRTGARAIGGVATALSIVVPVLIPTLQRAPVQLRPRHRRRRRHQHREPDGRPAPRPGPRRGRAAGHGAHRRPRPVVPADRGAQPVLRQRVELRRPRGARAARPADGPMPGLVGVVEPADRAASYDYDIEATRDFQLHVAAHHPAGRAASTRPATGATTSSPWTSSPATTTSTPPSSAGR